MDPVGPALSASRQLGMAYAIASDADGETTQAYRATSLPTVFVIDRQGIVRDVMVGYSSTRLAELSNLVDQLVREN
jgi:alkyl hydroperoxide reductase subunit AhpC